jgi:hypothetical protein
MPDAGLIGDLFGWSLLAAILVVALKIGRAAGQAITDWALRRRGW